MLVGDVISLRYQLEDDDTSKYVQATLYDEEFTELDDSPVNLSHLERGFYTNDSLLFPDGVKKIIAVYRVYEDPTYTIKSEDYYNGEDEFNLSSEGQAVDDIREIVASLPFGFNLDGEVLEDEP